MVRSGKYLYISLQESFGSLCSFSSTSRSSSARENLVRRLLPQEVAETGVVLGVASWDARAASRSDRACR